MAVYLSVSPLPSGLKSKMGRFILNYYRIFHLPLPNDRKKAGPSDGSPRFHIRPLQRLFQPDFHFRLWIFILIWSLSVLGLSAQTLLNKPESVAYDGKRDRFLVSNYGDGKIVAIDNQKRMKLLNMSEKSVRGLQVWGDHLYAASNRGIAVIDLETGETVKLIVIPGSRLLNDVAVDTHGFLYVSDTGANIIYKIRLRDHYISILTNRNLNRPSGLLYEARLNRLLVCSMINNSPIQAIDCETGHVSILIRTSLSNLDGLARDAAGFIYVSSWASGAVYRFRLDSFANPTRVSGPHECPADIFIRPVADVLVIPNYKSNRIDFISLSKH
jgi:sugar lactone lactonase YvrE